MKHVLDALHMARMVVRLIWEFLDWVTGGNGAALIFGLGAIVVFWYFVIDMIDMILGWGAR